MKRLVVFSGIVLLLGFLACQDGGKQAAKTESTDDESCVNPIRDPNEVKPMARMMRTMADYADSMRLHIMAGEKVDSIQYPLMPFWGAEPTDSSVLEPLFYNNAKQFAEAYRTLMSSSENQAAHYTAMINECVNCHSSYCTGPLKRIRKLPLDVASK